MEIMKPCPFCGNSDGIYVHVDESYFGPYIYVWCSRCDCCGPMIAVSCGGSVIDNRLKGKEDAVKTWNERK